jgi:hypothetical protein
VTKSRRSTKRGISHRLRSGEAPRSGPAVAAPADRQPIRSDIDGLGAVMEALGRRQFDLHSLSDAEWRRMSCRQQAELLRHQNRSQRLDHELGPRYFASPALERAVRRAHEMYVAMTPEQRRTVLHPKHLDQWLDERRAVTIVASDLESSEPLPAYLLPPSYAIPDEGSQPHRPASVYLTVSINLDTPRQGVLGAVEDLITGLHAPAARRPRRGASPRPGRNKYNDDDVARMIELYYRQATGESLKQLTIEAAGPKARHIAAKQSAMLRQLRWFRRELGIA